MHATEGLPTAFALLGTRARDKVALRIGGGCKGMDDDDKAEMLDIFVNAASGFGGVIWSGGTRQTRDGVVDPMVTDLPGAIAAAYPESGCVPLGTVPRTGMLTLQDESRLVLDEWGTVPNPDMHGILVVQNGADGNIDWDGDVDAYFKMMGSWKKYSLFSVVGTCFWNGGAVTEDEIMRSAKRGWPTILIRGSGRAADDYAERLQQDPEFMAQLPRDHQVRVVEKSACPDALHEAFVDYGFIATSSGDIAWH